MRLFFALALLLPVVLPAADSVDVYWIDVEGGASTLIVTQSGQSVLMDAGYAGLKGRDLNRILHVIRDEADIDRLDYFLTSHFHGDHVGGLPALAEKIEIGQFIDHGDSVQPDQDAWKNYLTAVGGRRRTVAPGDELELDGVDLTIVASHSETLPTPLPGGGPNSLCNNFQVHPEDKGENGKSLGYILRSGNFEFVNLGDLSWNFQYQLACPTNLLGKVDLFQATHHGVRDDVLPQQMWAMEPTVAVMNNGPTKGAGAEAVKTVLASPGLEDFWQLHRAVNNGTELHADRRLIANLGPTDGCDGHWIRARLNGDGTYTLLNGRNGFTKTYRVK